MAFVKGSPSPPKFSAPAQALLARVFTYDDGTIYSNKIFSGRHPHRFSSNPIYRGQIANKGKRFPGQHQAAIDEQTWNRVQQLLGANQPGRSGGRRRAG